MGSDNGGKAAAILYSIMASAKANQVEPFAYVRDLLDQLSRVTRPRLRRCFRTPGWRRTRNLAGVGRGSWATRYCDTEKLIFDAYSEFCLMT